MILRKRSWALFAILLLSGSALSWPPLQSRQEAAPAPGVGSPNRFMKGEIVGSPSCSARACHGGLKPTAQSRIGQNEYTQWLLHDPHAKAFDVLESELALDMGCNLRLPSRPSATVACLACHTEPRTAEARHRPDLIEERLLGIGCEACHGAAGGWLDAHVAVDWEKKTEAKVRQEAGMTLLCDPIGFAKTCVGCHVGAAASLGVPERNVTHDMIAAGHPRLAFEFGAFMDNLPRHWSDKREEAREPDFEARGWLAGQARVAQASLDLLQARAGTDHGTWPELAEYDCFACHRDLSSRNLNVRPARSRPVPGSLPWAEWPYVAARQLDSPKDLKPALDKLAVAMERPVPNRQDVMKLAAAAQSEVKTWLLAAEMQPIDPATWKARMSLLATACPENTYRSWDASAQIYYGLAAMAWGKDQSPLQPFLNDLAKTLEFHAEPKTLAIWNSPHQFDAVLFENRLKLVREELAKQK